MVSINSNTQRVATERGILVHEPEISANSEETTAQANVVSSAIDRINSLVEQFHVAASGSNKNGSRRVESLA
jgi:hypothetical protein